MKKNFIIFFTVVYLTSFSSFILPTAIPDEPQKTIPVQSKNQHPSK